MWANDSLHKDFIPQKSYKSLAQGVPGETIWSKIKPDAAEKLQNVTEGQNKPISHSRSCVTVIKSLECIVSRGLLLLKSGSNSNIITDTNVQ